MIENLDANWGKSSKLTRFGLSCDLFHLDRSRKSVSVRDNSSYKMDLAGSSTELTCRLRDEGGVGRCLSRDVAWAVPP